MAPRVFPSAVAIAIAVLLAVALAAPAQAAVNGGTKCVGCTVIVALVEQTMQIKNITASESMSTICSYFPGLLSWGCSLALDSFSKTAIPLIESGETPDAVCSALNFCNSQSGQTCRLFPAKAAGRHVPETVFQHHVAQLAKHHAHEVRSFNICTIIPQVCKVENHLPAFDNDNDRHSPKQTLRGAFWRGRDCNDSDPTVFPGRASSDRVVDTNCNGIYGMNPTTGNSYEQDWCANSGAMGIASLGDSATAHFRLPSEYFNASALSADVLANILQLVEDEADWPMLSWSTGHFNASMFSPDVKGPMDSVYWGMVNRNRCNHRDYANMGVNGARVANLYDFDGLMERNNNTKPAIVLYSMVGNDVCSGHQGFSSMTTPAQYYKAVLAALRRADTFLPKGSKVVMVPLVDGRILFDSMHNRIHPIGWTNKDVTYETFYDYLNCLEINPCWGWMNSNATVRNMTTAIAMKLGAQLPIIIKNTRGTWKNIQPVFLGNIYDNALNGYSGPKWELIEPVDGFHPSQTGNSIIGRYLFKTIVNASLLAPPNPFNQKIAAQFGDQGGY